MGRPAFSARATRAASAPDKRTPWPARITGRRAALISAAAVWSCRECPSRLGRKAGQPGYHLGFGRMLNAGGLLESVLGDVHVDRTGPPGAGDIKGLGQNPGSSSALRTR